jgi:hypothetical protein
VRARFDCHAVGQDWPQVVRRLWTGVADHVHRSMVNRSRGGGRLTSMRHGRLARAHGGGPKRQGEGASRSACKGEHDKALPHVRVWPEAPIHAATQLDDSGGTTASGYGAKEGRGGT